MSGLLWVVGSIVASCVLGAFIVWDIARGLDKDMEGY